LFNFPIENTYNGFHVTPNYYSTGGADGSLQRLIQQSMGNVAQAPNPQACNSLNTPFWSQLMSTQQNLFAGWSGFCGCPSPPQTAPQPQQPPTGHCGRRRVDIHVHHHFYQNQCGGPFTSSGGQGATSTSQTHNAFGAHGSGSTWQSSCSSSCYSPFSAGSYSNFGFGSTGLFGCVIPLRGFQGTYGNPGGGFQGSYGNPGGGYQGCYGGGYGGYQGSYGSAGNGYQGSYGGGYGGFQGSYGSPGGGYQGSYGQGYQNSYQPLPSYNLGDFNACFGGGNNSAFGVLPSSYAGYAMTSPFTDMGTAAGIAALGGALSLLF
jgi:hypothetical protein